MSKKVWILIALILVFALILSSCDTNNKPTDDNVDTNDNVDTDNNLDTNDNSDSNSGSDTTNNQNASEEYESVKLTAVDVFDKYMEKHPNTKIEKIELDKKLGSFQYEVQGYDDDKEYEIKIDPVSGDILDEKEENDRDNDGEITKEFLDKVEGLVEKSIQEEGEDAKLEQWTVEVDDGILTLEVELKKGTLGDIDYVYNLETGDLIEKD